MTSYHEALWAMNPNLTPEDIARLRLIRWEGRERCNAIMAKAQIEMPPEQYVEFLNAVLPVLVIM